MKVLVTGGAGYCGSVATAALLEAGHTVVVFDNISQGHRKAIPVDALFVEGDLRDMDAVERLFQAHRGFDGIIHFAAHTLVGESMEQPLKYLRDNLVAGANLLEQAVAHDVGRFIFSSTANLFGQPTRLPIEPHDCIAPGSPYGESKFFLERTLAWFERIYGLKYMALRYFNAAGATSERGEAHDPERHFIPLVLQVALGLRQQITIFGGDYPTKDGTCVRDYIHVADLAQAHILALTRLDQVGSRHYNLGSGAGFTNLEVIEMARRVTGHAIPHCIGPRRAGDPAVLIASAEAIREELGWEPQHSTLEQIVSSAWAWHRGHPQGYGS